MNQKSKTLNRFPLFGLFAYRAAVRVGFSDSESQLLGYGIALLFAILRNSKSGAKKGKKDGSETPVAEKAVMPDKVSFGGMNFDSIQDEGKIEALVIGGKTCRSAEFSYNIQSKFDKAYYAKLVRGFDAFLAQFSEQELAGKAVFSLYKEWRDACKSGWNLVDLDALLSWLKSNRRQMEMAF